MSNSYQLPITNPVPAWVRPLVEAPMAWAARMLATARAQREMESAIAELESMSDYELADIGITRDQIRDAVTRQ